MTRWLRSWPPVVWLLVYIGSLLVLMGGQQWDLLVAGLALIGSAFVLAVVLAGGRRSDHPRPKTFWWAMGGLAAIYGVMAGAAAVFLGWEYGVAALLAGLIPATAVALTFAAARVKTGPSDRGLEDRSAEAHDDPLPGIGMDEQTPLGDTPELSDADEDPIVARRRRLREARTASHRDAPTQATDTRRD